MHTREEIEAAIQTLLAELDKIPRRTAEEHLYGLVGHYTLELLNAFLINQARIADALETFLPAKIRY